MKGLFLGCCVVVALAVSVVTVQAQAAPKGEQCQEKLQSANTVLRTQAVTENMLEAEVKQKRSQVASLGLQLQEERQAHEQTKKALAKLQGAAESTKKVEPPKE